MRVDGGHVIGWEVCLGDFLTDDVRACEVTLISLCQMLKWGKGISGGCVCH